MSVKSMKTGKADEKERKREKRRKRRRKSVSVMTAEGVGAREKRQYEARWALRLFKAISRSLQREER